MNEEEQKNRPGKRFHYLTLAGIILLAIPSGFNEHFLDVVLILFGINLITGVLTKYREKSKFMMGLGVMCVFIGLFKLTLILF